MSYQMNGFSFHKMCWHTLKWRHVRRAVDQFDKNVNHIDFQKVNEVSFLFTGNLGCLEPAAFLI